MFYTCKKCLYTFEAKYKPEQCPDYGKREVREATEKEIEETQNSIDDGNEIIEDNIVLEETQEQEKSQEPVIEQPIAAIVMPRKSDVI